MKQKFVIAICSHQASINFIKEHGWKKAQKEPTVSAYIKTSVFNDLLERMAYDKGLRDAGYRGLITKYRIDGTDQTDNEPQDSLQPGLLGRTKQKYP